MSKISSLFSDNCRRMRRERAYLTISKKEETVQIQPLKAIHVGYSCVPPPPGVPCLARPVDPHTVYSNKSYYTSSFDKPFQSSRAQSFNIFEPKLLCRWFGFRQDTAWPRREMLENQQISSALKQVRKGKKSVNSYTSNSFRSQSAAAFNPTIERTNIRRGFSTSTRGLGDTHVYTCDSRNSPPLPPLQWVR